MKKLYRLSLLATLALTGINVHANDNTAANNMEAKCLALKAFTNGEASIAIKSAALVAAGPVPPVMYQAPYAGQLSAYCRVDGVIDERIGEGGKTYAISFALALPENWNGRFMMQGGGGLNGSVATPLGSSAAGDSPALQRGFAVVTTDTGHKGAHVFDGSFLADQEAVLNFLYQANSKVAIAAKQMTSSFYTRPVAHSYFMGCSTGGREAMIMSQRHPRLFDGIVAGAPAMRTGLSNLADKWVMVALAQAAPKDAQGKPLVEQVFDAKDKTLIMSALLKKCDGLDGVKDGMIFNPAACHFDPTELSCADTNHEACLAPAKAIALKKAFAGPKNARGKQVYPGFWFDTGITATQGIPGLLNPGAHPIFGKIDTTEMDVDEEADIAATASAFAGDSAYWTQLNTFSNHGGKLIFYHGVSDPWFSAQETTRYYQQLVKDNGGADKVSTWSRLFLVPGMGHCGGGAAALDHFDMIDPIVDWVEHQKAPDQIKATGNAFPKRSRPLCAYPNYAAYKGKGDSESAANFNCQSAK